MQNKLHFGLQLKVTTNDFFSSYFTIATHHATLINILFYMFLLTASVSLFGKNTWQYFSRALRACSATLLSTNQQSALMTRDHVSISIKYLQSSTPGKRIEKQNSRQQTLALLIISVPLSLSVCRCVTAASVRKTSAASRPASSPRTGRVRKKYYYFNKKRKAI